MIRKAVDYANDLIQSDFSKESLSALYHSLFCESKELKETRHVSTDAGLLSILNELIEKYHAICNIANKKQDKVVMKVDGFRIVLLLYFPFIAAHQLKPFTIIDVSQFKNKPLLEDDEAK